jgi:predicted Zn-dependent peptidase
VIRRLLSIASLGVVSVFLSGCVEEVIVVQPQPPPPPPPPTVTAPVVTPDPAPVVDGDITVLSINGLEVIVKKVPTAETFSARLVIRGGARNWTANDAGIEGVALYVATEGGTASLDKSAFGHRLSALGSEVSSGSNGDEGEISASGVISAFDETMNIFADTFLTPAMTDTEIELAKQRGISRLRHEQENPDSRLSLLLQQQLYKGHPFANRAFGTMESIPKLTGDQVRAHLAKLRETSRLLMVVVGNVEASHVADLVRAKFGNVARGAYAETPFPGIAFSQAHVEVATDKLPTNYIRFGFAGPRWGDKDIFVGVVAMDLLRMRLFETVRTKLNLTYAVSGGFNWGSSVPTGNLYTTAVDPQKTVEAMFGEVKRLKSTPVDEKELAGVKSTFLTGYLVGNESVGGQSEQLAETRMRTGDYHLAKTLPEKIRAVTAADVQAFANKYIVHMQSQVIGDPTKIDHKLFETY